MKNKTLRVLVTVATLTLSCGIFAGCGEKNESQQTQAESQVKQENNDEKPEPTETEPQETETEVAETESGADVVTVSEPENDSTAGGELSDDWVDMQFIFDGNSYQLPVSYSELEANGWSFDLADYGYETGYVMNSGDKTYGTIELTNPNYSEKLTVQVGFINNSDRAMDIKECDIWCFELDTCYGFGQVESYPDMDIAGGIGLGSSREEVDAAFGVCEDVYEATDYGYVTYSYDVDYTYYLKMTIYDDKGVTAIELSTYE